MKYRTRPLNDDERRIYQSMRGLVPSDQLEFINWAIHNTEEIKRAYTNRNLSLFMKMLFAAYELGKQVD